MTSHLPPATCYLALVHHPVYNKAGDTITSGITNLDVHDIARSVMTYGIKTFYLIHPNQRQQKIIEHILQFWKTELASFYNPHRTQALATIDFKNTLEDTINTIKNQETADPIIITTTANTKSNQLSFPKARKLINCSERPILLLFGTGNGLHESVHQKADYILKPIQASTGYNHLSVRSAVAIVLDRLFSEEYRRKLWTSSKPKQKNKSELTYQNTE